MAIALGLAVALPGVADALSHAGLHASSTWSGINGYLSQTLTTPTSGAHAVWINVCNSDCSHWVQTGTIQGVWAGGSDTSAIEVYRENKDACGDYYADDLGAPPSSNFPYSLNWDGNTYQVIPCNNGSHHSAYTWLYRKGGVTTTPFWDGDLELSSGYAIAAAEYQGGAPETTDWIGCTASHTCSTSAYGLHLLSGSTWQLMTVFSTPYSDGDPPWLHLYNSYWSFKSCATSC